MSRILVPSDPVDNFADLCANTPYYIIATDGPPGAALAGAMEVIGEMNPPFRGVCPVTDAACVELYFTTDPLWDADLGRLCARATPWRSLAELLEHAQCDAVVDVFDGSDWWPMRVAEGGGE